MTENLLLALNALAQLLQQALSVNSLITSAQSAGVDITDAQLTQASQAAAAAIAQLAADIATAKTPPTPTT